MAVRLGAGAAFANDRIQPSVDLVASGKLDYLVLECLAERTLAYGHIERLRDPSKGYNPRLRQRLGAVLKLCQEHKVRIVTNMGCANPRAAGVEAAKLARELGIKIRIAVVEGDDVSDLMTPDTELPDLGMPLRDFKPKMVSANAYIGVDALLPALETGADLIIAGRASDSSLFLAPAAYAFGWATDDWQMMAAGALAGHLLECTTQVTGGYYADPGYKTVPGIADVGYPIGEVTSDGVTTVTKVENTGGCVTDRTIKEQLIYEVHDPRRYLTPDVSADFTTVRIDDDGNDRVTVSNATGNKRPDRLKVVVGFDGGFLAEGELSYGGPGARERAELSRQIVLDRVSRRFAGEIRLDIIGVNSIHATAVQRPAETQDVRLRAALRSHDMADAELLIEEVECLAISGPAGGGGFRGRVSPSILTHAAFVDRNAVQTNVEVIEA